MFFLCHDREGESMKVLAVSGYRHYELGVFSEKHPGIGYIKKAIEQRFREFLDEGLEWVVISGQTGVEMWCADVVFSLQEEFPHLKLSMLQPFLQQEERYNDMHKMKYEEIILLADHVDAITKRPYENPSQLRMKNDFIVRHTDALLVLYDEEKEGTPKFIVKSGQQKEGYPIFYITSYDLQSIVEEEMMNNSYFFES